MQSEIEYLGYLLTAEGIRPQPKKVNAMMRVQASNNHTQLKRVLGMINFYRDMWFNCLHILAPLNKLVEGNKKERRPWKWTDVEQKAFEAV